MVEYASIGWKIVENLFSWVGGPIWRAIVRKRAQRLVRASDGGKISIMLARLEGDSESNPIRESIREAIRRELGDAVSITTWPDLLRMGEGHELDVERVAYETAQSWLKQKGCDLLVWGRIKGRSVVSLRFTIAGGDSRDAESYQLTDKFDLPVSFIAELGAAIAARTVLTVAPVIGDGGQYLVPVMRRAAERLLPIIQRLNPASGRAYDPDTRGTLFLSYGLVCDMLGEQEGINRYLETALTSYGFALEEWTHERAPIGWAIIQTCLGLTLWRLGKRETDNVHLEQAIIAFREALREFTRDHDPKNWALVQNNLGLALWTLGERESGSARLMEAVEVLQEGICQCSRESSPLEWAGLQDCLGNVLAIAGDRENNIERLELAVTSHREALKERTRERAPLLWAMTKTNLALALRKLGERRDGLEELEEAVEASHEALKEYTRQRVPLDWARAQTALGNVLQTLGGRSNNSARYEEAVVAYREALKEYTRERMPLDWAMI